MACIAYDMSGDSRADMSGIAAECISMVGGPRLSESQSFDVTKKVIVIQLLKI